MQYDSTHTNVRYTHPPPASPAWYAAMLQLPEDVQSEIKVNATILRRVVKDKHIPMSQASALALVARLYIGVMLTALPAVGKSLRDAEPREAQR